MAGVALYGRKTITLSWGKTIWCLVASHVREARGEGLDVRARGLPPWWRSTGLALGSRPRWGKAVGCLLHWLRLLRMIQPLQRRLLWSSVRLSEVPSIQDLLWLILLLQMHWLVVMLELLLQELLVGKTRVVLLRISLLILLHALLCEL